MKIFVFLIVLIFGITACQFQKEELPIGQVPALEKKTAVVQKTKYFPVFYWEERKEKEPLEPDSGCMTGAYMTEDANVDGKISVFEEKTQKSSDVYGKDIYVGGESPFLWILECVAANKTPIVTIYPKNRNEPFSTADLEKTAKALGALPIPIFVQFYPNPASYGDSLSYQEFYQKARKIFRKNAPYAFFVWSVMPEDGPMAKDYYPGEEAVDWIGLELYERSGEQGIYTQEKLEEWYYTWQKEKPLMLFAAISHYSTSDTKYTEAEAAKELERLYSSLKSYPRIKCVLYRNENHTAQGPVKADRENYLITDNVTMLESYRNALSDSWLSKKTEEKLGEWYRSPFLACKKNGILYLQRNSVYYDLGEDFFGYGQTFDGKVWIMADSLENSTVEQKEDCVVIVPRKENL